MTDARRGLPSVSALLERAEVRALMDSSPRAVVVAAIRDVITGVRTRETPVPESDSAWIAAITQRVAQNEQPSLRRAINATGIVLHTNLGRAPLATAAIDAMSR